MISSRYIEVTGITESGIIIARPKIIIEDIINNKQIDKCVHNKTLIELTKELELVDLPLQK